MVMLTDVNVVVRYSEGLMLIGEEQECPPGGTCAHRKALIT